MEESLYSEYGFFNTEKTRSNKEGDFLTSPEVSDYFGLFISNWMNENEIENNVVAMTQLLLSSNTAMDRLKT